MARNAGIPLAALLTLCTICTGKQHVHVSTTGSDNWTGTLAEPAPDGSDGPLATVRAALDAAGRLRAEQPQPDEPLVIEIAGGTYFLDEPILITPADSGTPGSPTVIRAAPGARPLLSGGRVISGWTVGDDGRWRAELPPGTPRFSQLFANDQRRSIARLPAEGYFTIAEAVEPSPAAAGRGHDRFRYAEGDVDPAWAGDPSIEFLIFNVWSGSSLRPSEIDGARRIVRFSGPTRTTAWWGGLPAGHRYIVLGAGLDAPGEWALDASGTDLTYIPLPGETPQNTTIIAPRLERLLILRGDRGTGHAVEHVQIEGLTFAHARWTTPDEGSSYPQAALGTPAAVSLIAARECIIRNCAVRHVGGYAMQIWTACRGNRVEGCEIVDLGAGGVRVGFGGGPGSWPVEEDGTPGDEADRVTGNTVRQCLIAHGGRLHPPGVGVWIGHADHTTIEHNTIFDLYYTGVSVGWVWGYTPSPAHHNTIAHNHIHDIGQGVLSDMAGVYTLGVSPGTTIHHNLIHNIESRDYGGWGLYTDEGSTGIVMENNLVHHTTTGGFHQHYGRENVIRNNILAFSANDQLQRTRVEDHLSFTFERNIVCYDKGQLLGMSWEDECVILRNNLYWNAAGPTLFPGNRTLEQWRSTTGHDEGSIVADPMLADPARGDYTLSDASPALRLGFQPFDVSRAGRTLPLKLTSDLPPVPAAFRR